VLYGRIGACCEIYFAARSLFGGNLLQEKIFCEKICKAGGQLYIAGGWVRDKIRGVLAKDKDYVVAAIDELDFCRMFPEAIKVGKSFPVYLLEINGQKSEVAFARKEKKTGIGYRGFIAFCDKTITIEEDLYRRDTTMNSMAWKLPEEVLIDPYGGRCDIEKRTIRATSQHFSEDPVRGLRAARQAAEMDFEVAIETINQMSLCQSELVTEPQERFFQELVKALACKKPSVFFRVLQAAGLLKIVFPEIFFLRGKIQPKEFHPEGDAFEHSMQMVDEVASAGTSTLVRFAALVHDIGKGATLAQELPHHYGHEIKGITVFKAWASRMTFPKTWQQAAEFIIREHMRAPRLSKPGKIVDFLLAAEKNPLGLSGIGAVVLADHKSLPDYLLHHEHYLRHIHEVRGSLIPTGLSGRQIAIWLRQKQIQAYQLGSASRI
jgi:tRNA nucleotidyltransferase (CCA-adding enzyme)